MTKAAVLKEYFEVQPEYKGEKGLKGFMAELKELSDEDKTELAEGAAKELGVTLD